MACGKDLMCAIGPATNLLNGSCEVPFLCMPSLHVTSPRSHALRRGMEGASFVDKFSIRQLSSSHSGTLSLVIFWRTAWIPMRLP